MATGPREQNPLSDGERKAYRNLLYDAMLDIRNLCQPRGRLSKNPLVWYRQYRQGRCAGALADWLHNLAQYAASDFFDIDTDWFWQEYNGVCKAYPDWIGPGKWMDYRDRYERHLAKQSPKNE